MNTRWRIIAESVATAGVAYVVAGATEATLIRTVRPTELELAWVSDIVLSAALGVAVYLWRHLLVTRRDLVEQERAELVIQTQLSVAEEMQRRYRRQHLQRRDGAGTTRTRAARRAAVGR